MNIRPAISDLSIFKKVFALPPAQLSDDYRTRQAQIAKLIATREPDAMATALRDLCWREQTDKLTSVEMKMKSNLIKMISHEIAVIKDEMSVESATSYLSQLLYDMVHQDETEADEAAVSQA